MTGNDTLRGEDGEFAEIGQPAAKAAVEHRDVAEEYQIAREQGSALPIENGQIVVAVRRGPRAQAQGSSAEIKRHGIIDQQGRRHDADLIDQLVAHDAAKIIDVERPMAGKRAGQVLMANEDGSVV